LGWDIVVHAIGDAAARNVLDAFDGAARGSICRLEHCQTMHPDDISRMSEADRIASVQPIHMYSDAAWADSILSEQQLDRLFRWRDLLDVAPLAAGSDFPIEDPNPWHGIATFLSRRDANGVVFRPEQAVSRKAALTAYTTGAARAARWNALGELSVGNVAEWIATDVDPWTATPGALWDTTVTDSSYIRTR
jgi:predicted amidohydrolase YtcJ